MLRRAKAHLRPFYLTTDCDRFRSNTTDRRTAIGKLNAPLSDMFCSSRPTECRQIIALHSFPL